MAKQFDIFASTYGSYKIEKPIRLIELFSGIGAQHKALSMLGIPFESWKTCEWAYNSIIGYNAIHIKDNTDYAKDLTREQLLDYLNGNISINYNEPADLTKKPLEWLKKCYNSCIANHNLMNIMTTKGKDLEIVDTDKYDYLMTYSFPCQDLSLAGKRLGMSVSQNDGGTRSGLLWEVKRLLDECNEIGSLPKILLMENVPEVIGQKNIADFQKWELYLSNLGYENNISILNGKDYGIPQNRRRCFMISILNDYYEFPNQIELKYRLKDFLEKEADEKYYLSDQTIERISQWKSQQQPIDNAIDIERERERVSPTLTARGAGEEHSGMVLIKENIPNNKMSGGLPIKNATETGYLLAEEGDGINICGRMEYQRGNVQKGLALTINTKGTDGGVCVRNEQETEKSDPKS